jgi:hypothetical protein
MSYAILKVYEPVDGRLVGVSCQSIVSVAGVGVGVGVGVGESCPGICRKSEYPGSPVMVDSSHEPSAHISTQSAVIQAPS